MKKAFQTLNKEETIQLGKDISKYLFAGSVITLTGDLGAGKTTFAMGVAQGLKIKDKISSPTFNIMKCYFYGTLPFYHIDAYRLEDNANKDLGLEEYIEGNGVCLIEWPNFIEDKIDNNMALNIEILHNGLNSRIITIETNNEQYQTLFDEYLRGK